MNKKAPKASIYQRSSDMKWVGSISQGKKPDGSRNRITIYGDSENEVSKRINIMLYEIQTEQYICPDKETLIDFLKEYHKICAGFDVWDINSKPARKSKWAQTTSNQYKEYIDVHFIPYFKKMKLIDIKTITLDTFYNHKLTTERKHDVKQGNKVVTKIVPPLGINTVLKLFTFLNAAFEYAIINEKIKKNPNIGTVMSGMKKEAFSPAIYDIHDYLKLMDCVKGKDEEIPVILAAGCGLRRGEICGLRWGDVDFENNIISIENNKVRLNPGNYIEKDPKTKKSRRKIKVPIYVTKTLMDHYIKKGNPDSTSYVITKWKPQALSDRFDNIITKNGLKKIRFHDLRHYNATVMLKSGISDRVAADRLGHSNVSTLNQIYQHVLDEMDESAADIINMSITPASEKPNLRVIK